MVPKEELERNLIVILSYLQEAKVNLLNVLSSSRRFLTCKTVRVGGKMLVSFALLNSIAVSNYE